MKPNAIQTSRTYKTFENAKNALVMLITKSGRDIDNIRWLIAVNDAGRFAPVIIGALDNAKNSNLDFAHFGITVVG